MRNVCIMFVMVAIVIAAACSCTAMDGELHGLVSLATPPMEKYGVWSTLHIGVVQAPGSWCWSTLHIGVCKCQDLGAGQLST